MACGNSCEKQATTTTCCEKHNCGGHGYVCIVVLYILLAIIIGSFIVY